MATYPATNTNEASELLVDVSNQMHEIVNEDAVTEVTTESGPVPSVRKALADTFLFVEPVAWDSGNNETAFNQLRTFGDETYWAPTATLTNPIAMGATPVGDNNWRLAPTGKNSSIVQQWDTAAQEELINGKIYPEIGTLSNGDTVPLGTTHLRVLIGGEATVVAMSPIASGAVSLLTETSATIGGVTISFNYTVVEFYTATDLLNNTRLFKTGQKVRTYKNLGGVDSDQVWEIVSALPSGSEFGVAIASGQFAKLTLNTTITLSDIGGVPYSINTTYDNLPIWYRALELEKEIYLDDFYSVNGTVTFEKHRINLRGKGIDLCGFVGLNPSVPVFQTCPLVSSATTTTGHKIEDFSVKGVGSAAFVFARITGATIGPLGCVSFKGVDGFIFEYFWSCDFGLLTTAGAVLTGIPFKFNGGHLDSYISHLYTSNLTDVLFQFSNQYDFTSSPSGGTGRLTIGLMTMQGAQVCATRILTTSDLVVLNTYTENNQKILEIGEDGGAINDVVFTGDFTGFSGAGAFMTIDGKSTGNVSGVTFRNCTFPLKDIELGRFNLGLRFDNCRMISNGLLINYLKRNSNALTTLSMSASYESTNGSYEIKKTTGFLYRLSVINYSGGDGLPVATLIDVPLIA